VSRGFPRPRRRPPTDFELLRHIHERYADDFRSGYPGGRSSKPFVPLDIPAIADQFGVDVDSIFGRLHYHLEREYGERDQVGGRPRKQFFVQKVGDDANAVNFPFLEAVLAGLWEQRRRDTLALWTAILSLGIALAALLVSILA
jgi:hypothetical protein